MENKNKTKEELEKEIELIQDDNGRLLNEDTALRKEFAQAFGWIERETPFNIDEPDPITPSWEQIFVEIGKLLHRDNLVDFEPKLEQLEENLKQINKRLNPKKLNPGDCE